MIPGLSGWLVWVAQGDGRANLQGWKEACQAGSVLGQTLRKSQRVWDALEKSPISKSVTADP